jgi:hypothetical protein
VYLVFVIYVTVCLVPCISAPGGGKVAALRHLCIWMVKIIFMNNLWVLFYSNSDFVWKLWSISPIVSPQPLVKQSIAILVALEVCYFHGPLAVRVVYYRGIWSFMGCNGRSMSEYRKDTSLICPVGSSKKKVGRVIMGNRRVYLKPMLFQINGKEEQ